MIDFQKSLGFIILNPDNNPTALRITTNTIRDNFPHVKVASVIGAKADDSNQIKGGNTITSLMDAGLKKTKTEWCLITMAGTYIRHYHLRKYGLFLKDEKEILYPVVNKKYAFDEATINGILIHKKAIEDVGTFGDDNWNIQLVKMLWAIKAIDKGYRFKALVGARLA